MKAGNYTVKIAGVELDGWESIQAQKTFDFNVEKATITFPDILTMNYALKQVGSVGPPISGPLTANLPKQDIDVQIMRDGAIKWRGLAWHRTRYLSGSKGSMPGEQTRQYSLQCLSNKQYLAREAMRYTGNGSNNVTFGNANTPTYFDVIYGGAQSSSSASITTSSTLCTSILNDILNCQKGASGAFNAKSPNNIPSSGGKLTGSSNIGPNAGRTTYPHVCLYFIRSYCLAALTQLINASLWETRFNENNTVDFQNQVGSQTSVRTFNEGDNLVDIQEDFGLDTAINDVIVCGAGSANPNPLNQTITDDGIASEDDSSPSSGPRYSEFFSMSNIFDPTLLQTYASALSADLQYSQTTIPISVVEALPGVNWHLGDVVNMLSPSFGYYNQQFRIYQEKFSYDYQNGEEIDLLLMPSLHQASVAHTRARALEYILNSQTANGQLFQNTVQQSPSSYPTYINMSGYSNSGQGGSGNISVYGYMTIARTGIGTGGTYYIAGLATSESGATGLVLNLLEIYDVTTSTTLYSNSNPGNGGAVYSYTDAVDRLDHLIRYQASGTVNAGYGVTVTFLGGQYPTSPYNCAIVPTITLPS